MRPPLAVLACLCLLLAGCGAVPSQGGGPSTVNPALAETPTVSPTPDPAPTTVSDDAIDARMLADAHASALANRSVTVTVASRMTYDNGTVRAEAVQRSFAGAGGEQLYRVVTTETPYRLVNDLTFNISYWRNDTVTVERQEYENGSAVLTLVEGGYPAGRSMDFDPTGAHVVDLLGRYDLVEDRVVLAGGEPLRRIVESDTDQPYRPFRSNVSVEVLVTEEGIVRSIAITYRTTRFRSPATVRTTVTVSGIGNTTVPRPEWVNETLARDR